MKKKINKKKWRILFIFFNIIEIVNKIPSILKILKNKRILKDYFKRWKKLCLLYTKWYIYSTCKNQRSRNWKYRLI